MPDTPHTLIKQGEVVNYTPPFTNFSQFLAQRAIQYTTKPALIYIDNDSQSNDNPLTLSYQELNQKVRQLALLLQTKWQLKPGDAISFAFPNTPEVVLLNYAAWSIGVTTVPLDTKRDTTDRKVYKLSQTEAKLFFTRCDEKTRTENAKIRQELPGIEIVSISDFATFDQLIVTLTEYQTMPHHVHDADCLILYTSGTTALPKGCRLTLTSLFANAQSIADWLQFDEADRFHVLLPLHHINSTTFVNTTLLRGGTVILSSQYSKSKFWKTMAEHQATGASIVPTIAYDLLSEKEAFAKHFDNSKTASQQIRRIQLGSAPVQPTVVKKFVDAFGIPLMQGYGQTETSLRSTGVPMDLTREDYLQAVELNTLGTELKYTNVTVLKADGSEAIESEEGEICIRGPVIMQGYLNNPPATKEAFEYDWFHSGDTGFFRMLFDRKFFFLKGRSKEIIKKGGVLISPLAIENALLSAYPELEQVYVIGFPDLRMGELIGFVAVSKNPKIVEQILVDSRDKNLTALSAYELPSAGLLITEADLPKTSTGKVQRINLKTTYAPQLLEQYRTIVTVASAQQGDKTTTLRVIGAEETETLQRATEIDTKAWGSTLGATQSQMKQRAENGVLIGLFDHTKTLHGTISALRIMHSELERCNEAQFWTSSWDGVTGDGTLSTHNHKGDALLLVAVATQQSKSAQAVVLSGDMPTQTEIAQYIQNHQDPVITFHETPKAGMPSGAKIATIIPNGRPADTSALGYSVLMQYPTLQQEPTITIGASWGTQLVECALLYAWQNGLKHVFAYSRPVSLATHFST